MSPVQQIILDETADGVVASGVVYTDYSSGQTVNATAKKEVIISAGTFKTPQLLMLSVWQLKYSKFSHAYHSRELALLIFLRKLGSNSMLSVKMWARSEFSIPH
jgi:hypothetical protein